MLKEIFNKEWICNFLREEDEIANLNILGVIDHVDKGIFNNPKDQLKMYVDDEENPKGVLVVEHEYWHYIYAKNQQFLDHLKTHYFSRDKAYGFAAVDDEVYQYFKEAYTLEWDEFCHLLYVDPKKFQPITPSIDITSGTEADVKLVNDLYTFKEEGSDDFIRDNLKHRPSSFYRIDGEPVSWVMVHRDDSIGIMYTKKEYRGKGIAYELSMDLVHKIIQRNKIPYIHVHLDNKASLALASKIGFVSYKKIVWFGIKPA